MSRRPQTDDDVRRVRHLKNPTGHNNAVPTVISLRRTRGMSVCNRVAGTGQRPRYGCNKQARSDFRPSERISVGRRCNVTPLRKQREKKKNGIMIGRHLSTPGDFAVKVERSRPKIVPNDNNGVEEKNKINNITYRYDGRTTTTPKHTAYTGARHARLRAYTEDTLTPSISSAASRSGGIARTADGHRHVP